VAAALSKDTRVYPWRVEVVNDFSGKGYGHTLKRGIERSKGDWILIMDADFTYSPWDIHKLIDELPYSDMVVAERRGTFGASGVLRSIGRLIIKRYACMRTGFPIVDINSGFRIFKRETYEECKDFLPDKFSFTSTLTMYCFARGLRVNYMPVFYQTRVGKSSLKWWEFFNFIRTINRCQKNFKFKTE